MNKVSVVVEFTEAEFKSMLKEADMKIINKAKFNEVFKSKEFAQALSADLKDVWLQTNIDTGDMDLVFDGLGFDGCVVAPEWN